MTTKQIQISTIARRPEFQARAAIRPETIQEYKDLIDAGVEFPPVDVWVIDGEYVLVDGWHRLAAYEATGAKAISANIYDRGGREGAVLHALQANAAHGLKRSNEDKRRCVQMALTEWPDRSSREIAEVCGVGHALVDSLRALADSANAPATRTTKDGRQYPAKRASAPQKPAEPAPEPEPEPPHIQTATEEQAALDSSSAATTAATGTDSGASSTTVDSGADDVASLIPAAENEIWMAQMAALNTAQKFGRPGIAYLISMIPRAQQLLNKWRAQ